MIITYKGNVTIVHNIGLATSHQSSILNMSCDEGYTIFSLIKLLVLHTVCICHGQKSLLCLCNARPEMALVELSLLHWTNFEDTEL